MRTRKFPGPQRRNWPLIWVIWNVKSAWLELQMFDIMEDREIHRAAVTWSLLSNVERKNSLIYVLRRLISIRNTSCLIKDVFFHMRPANNSVSAVLGIYEFDRGTFDKLSWKLRYQDGKFILLDDSLHLAAMKQSGRKDEPALYIVQIALDHEEHSLDGPVEQIFRERFVSFLGYAELYDCEREGDHRLLRDVIIQKGWIPARTSWPSKGNRISFTRWLQKNSISMWSVICPNRN